MLHVWNEGLFFCCESFVLFFFIVLFDSILKQPASKPKSISKAEERGRRRNFNCESSFSLFWFDWRKWAKRYVTRRREQIKLISRASGKQDVTNEKVFSFAKCKVCAIPRQILRSKIFPVYAAYNKLSLHFKRFAFFCQFMRFFSFIKITHSKTLSYLIRKREFLLTDYCFSDAIKPYLCRYVHRSSPL